MPKYTNQIVVFLDILGFSNMLQSFEDEALLNGDFDEENFHESIALNDLLGIFKNSIGLIQERNCNHYLFSDNICITIDYVVDGFEHPKLFIEILQLINILNYEFIQKGYFLRGGVDAGWFLDSRDMAAGTPLLEAYHLESKVANYPRIVISDRYKKLIDEMNSNNQFNDEQSFLLEYILKDDGANHYINNFLHILNFEDPISKGDFLTTYRDNIVSSIIKHRDNERILSKYLWSAEKFNHFLDEYTLNNEAFEVDGLLDTEYIETLKDLKIS
ncbi:MAG: hypothetical protein V4541_01100 [Bacteroidota bacterium]